MKSFVSPPPRFAFIKRTFAEDTRGALNMLVSPSTDLLPHFNKGQTTSGRRFTPGSIWQKGEEEEEVGAKVSVCTTAALIFDF